MAPGNGSGVLSDIPQWAKPILQASAVVILSSIAVYLVLLVAGELRADTKLSVAKLEAHVTATQNFEKELTGLRAEIAGLKDQQKSYYDKMLAFQRVQCLNTAGTNPARQATCMAIQ